MVDGQTSAMCAISGKLQGRSWQVSLICPLLALSVCIYRNRHCREKRIRSSGNSRRAQSRLAWTGQAKLRNKNSVSSLSSVWR